MLLLFQEEKEEANVNPSDSHIGDTQTECKHKDLENTTEKSAHGIYNDAYDADINTRL